MIFQFVLVDLTTKKTPESMKPAASFSAMIVAWKEQINGPFATAYGRLAATFRVAKDTADRNINEIGINFRDTTPEAPGALAFHQVVNGVPDIEIAVDLFNSLTSGVDAVSVGVGHEIDELFIDAGANGWKDKGNGVMGAEESVDPVQNTYYLACNKVAVPNFVFPEYFIPGSKGPWDYMQVMASQDDISHGYEIQAATPSQINQVEGKRGFAKTGEKHVFIVGAELTELQLKRKQHPYSRTMRRGVRL